MMITITPNNAALVVRGPTLDDANFSFGYEPHEVLLSGSSGGTITDADAVLEVFTPATIDVEADLRAEEVTLGALAGVTFENLTPAVATLDPDTMHLGRVADGTAVVLARTPLLTRRVDVPIARVGGVTTEQFLYFAPGSLSRHCADAVDARIAGLVPSQAMPLFASRDDAAGAYVRNPACWLAGLAGLTAISPWNGKGGARWGVTAVAPDAAVTAEHIDSAAGWVGVAVRFVTLANETITRTVAAAQAVGPSNGDDAYATDQIVLRFDSPLPASITPVEALGADRPQKMSRVGYGVPFVSINQAKLARVAEFYAFDGMARVRTHSEDAERQAFGGGVFVGDSGHPDLFIVSGGLALASTKTYGGLNPSGPDVSSINGPINAALSAAGSSHQLATVDLTGFPTY